MLFFCSVATWPHRVCITKTNANTHTLTDRTGIHTLSHTHTHTRPPSLVPFNTSERRIIGCGRNLAQTVRSQRPLRRHSNATPRGEEFSCFDPPNAASHACTDHLTVGIHALRRLVFLTPGCRLDTVTCRRQQWWLDIWGHVCGGAGGTSRACGAIQYVVVLLLLLLLLCLLNLLTQNIKIREENKNRNHIISWTHPHPMCVNSFAEFCGCGNNYMRSVDTVLDSKTFMVSYPR